MQSARMARLACLSLVVFLVAGCSSPGSSHDVVTTGGGNASRAPEDAAATYSRSQLNLLLGGASTPPSIVTWEDVITGKKLTSTQSTAFCGALGIRGADEAIAAILAAGLNALSLRLRKKPLASEAEDLVGVAATFATTTCPAWDPTRRAVATPKPIPRWYQSGYTPLLLQPDVAFRPADPKTEPFACDDPQAACYGIHIATKDGCPGVLKGTIATKDPNGVVLELIFDSKLVLPGSDTLLVFDLTNTDATSWVINTISCDA